MQPIDLCCLALDRSEGRLGSGMIKVFVKIRIYIHFVAYFVSLEMYLKCILKFNLKLTILLAVLYIKKYLMAIIEVRYWSTDQPGRSWMKRNQ